jgi:hypothetical protein
MFYYKANYQIVRGKDEDVVSKIFFTHAESALSSEQIIKKIKIAESPNVIVMVGEPIVLTQQQYESRTR